MHSNTLPTAGQDRLVINAIWLMKLRWVAVVGQGITIVVVTFGLDVPVQLAPLLIALAIVSLSNLGFTLWLRAHTTTSDKAVQSEHWNRVFIALLVLDLAVLTALLYFTGGHTNPFVLFYFVNLALSGMLLPPPWAWLLNLLSIISFAALFYFQVPLTELRQSASLLGIRETGTPTLAQLGLLVAFATCSTVIVYFATRLTAELILRDHALRRSEIRQARSEKWEALGTLAAGAAHELATPLTTIAVISKEMQLELESQQASETAIQDIKMVRAELDRCRGILDQMSTDAGHVTAETPALVEAASLLEQVQAGLPNTPARVQVQWSPAAQTTRVRVPLQSFAMALRGIVQNALDASPQQPVEVIVSSEAHQLCIRVRDQGVGMSPDVLQRADEPFFSTKEAGRGMGLGRFLARSVFERWGASFTTESTPDVGTEVTIRIPRADNP